MAVNIGQVLPPDIVGVIAQFSVPSSVWSLRATSSKLRSKIADSCEERFVVLLVGIGDLHVHVYKYFWGSHTLVKCGETLVPKLPYLKPFRGKRVYDPLHDFFETPRPGIDPPEFRQRVARILYDSPDFVVEKTSDSKKEPVAATAGGAGGGGDTGTAETPALARWEEIVAQRDALKRTKYPALSNTSIDDNDETGTQEERATYEDEVNALALAKLNGDGTHGCQDEEAQSSSFAPLVFMQGFLLGNLAPLRTAFGASKFFFESSKDLLDPFMPHVTGGTKSGLLASRRERQKTDTTTAASGGRAPVAGGKRPSVNIHRGAARPSSSGTTAMGEWKIKAKIASLRQLTVRRVIVPQPVLLLSAPLARGIKIASTAVGAPETVVPVSIPLGDASLRHLYGDAAATSEPRQREDDTNPTQCGVSRQQVRALAPVAALKRYLQLTTTTSLGHLSEGGVKLRSLAEGIALLGFKPWGECWQAVAEGCHVEQDEEDEFMRLCPNFHKHLATHGHPGGAGRISCFTPLGIPTPGAIGGIPRSGGADRGFLGFTFGEVESWDAARWAEMLPHPFLVDRDPRGPNRLEELNEMFMATKLDTPLAQPSARKPSSVVSRPKTATPNAAPGKSSTTTPGRAGSARDAKKGNLVLGGGKKEDSQATKSEKEGEDSSAKTSAAANAIDKAEYIHVGNNPITGTPVFMHCSQALQLCETGYGRTPYAVWHAGKSEEQRAFYLCDQHFPLERRERLAQLAGTEAASRNKKSSEKPQRNPAPPPKHSKQYYAAELAAWEDMFWSCRIPYLHQTDSTLYKEVVRKPPPPAPAGDSSGTTSSSSGEATPVLDSPWLIVGNGDSWCSEHFEPAQSNTWAHLLTGTKTWFLELPDPETGIRTWVTVDQVAGQTMFLPPTVRHIVVSANTQGTCMLSRNFYVKEDGSKK